MIFSLENHELGEWKPLEGKDLPFINCHQECDLVLENAGRETAWVALSFSPGGVR